MENEFLNRLDRSHRSLAVLALPEHKPVWNSQPPLIFTEKVSGAQLMVKTIEEAQKRKERGLGGFTQEKDREEAELDDAAFTLAQALVQYSTDHREESEAGAFDLTIADWRKLRDQQLLAKAQLVLDRVGALSVGPTATVAAKCGLTPAAAQALTKERANCDAILNAPDTALVVRKALTQGVPSGLPAAGSEARGARPADHAVPHDRSGPGAAGGRGGGASGTRPGHRPRRQEGNSADARSG